MWYAIALRTLFFTYMKDKTASDLILKYTKLGIEKIEYTDVGIHVFFPSGVGLHGLNVDKYASWLSDGLIYNSRGILYEWYNKRPSAKAMYKLEQAIEEYHALTGKPVPKALTI
jgi:hypothetical protein